MYTLIIVIHVIACFILIAAILLQAGRGGGLSELFSGGGGSQTLFGVRTPKLLTGATTVAAIIFLLSCITLTILSSRRGKSLFEKERIITEQTQEEKPGGSETQPQVPQE